MNHGGIREKETLMILSNTPHRTVFSRLLLLAFLCALSIHPRASVAEDKKAKSKPAPKDHYKQIEAAVLAGKITKEEAQAKLKALNKQGAPKSKAITKGHDKKGYDKKTIANLENIWAELQSLVASGKMSPDEAATVMSSIKQKVFGKTSVNNNKKANFKISSKDHYKAIESAVAAGKITKEQAQAKLGALKKEGLGKKQAKGKETKTKAKTSPNDFYKQIESAVLAGKITKEEAQAKLKALNAKGSPKTNDQGKTAPTDAYFKKVWSKLQAAVAAGKLTKEEAAAKMTAIKKAKSGGE